MAQIVWLQIEGRSLEGAPLSGKTKRIIPVYLPPNYQSDLKARFPTAYILAGWGSKGASYAADTSAFGVSLPDRLDDAILNKRLKPTIVVFHDGSTPWGGSQYVNSPTFGRHSDYLCEEVVQKIDREFRTIPERHARAVLGHSSGGYGALWNFWHRGDVFGLCGSSAGDSQFATLFPPLIRYVIDELEKSKSPASFIQDYISHPNPFSLPRSKGEALMLLCMCACFMPNLNNPPFYSDLFFDLRTGRIFEDSWERMLKWDPLKFCQNDRPRGSETDFIFLDHGKQDEYGLQLGQRQLFEILQKKNIPSELSEYPGGHSGFNWKYEERLIKLINRLAD